jgi:hypothetical protein
MLLNERVFYGANRYYRSNEALWHTTGPIYRFTEFQPVNFTCLSFVYVLLDYFFGINICCHSCWDIPSYVAGFQTSFHTASIFFALKEHPILKLIVQFVANPAAHF